MKKIISLILIFTFLSTFVSFANAANCAPRWNGTWTVTADCTYAQTAKIFGDIIVWPYTVTVPTWIVMGIDMTVNKMTFTTGKVMFQGSAKADNTTSVRYEINVTYSVNATTACPSGMNVRYANWSAVVPTNPFSYPTATPGGYYDNVAQSGTLYCVWP